jgi:putative oxidoreductase
MSSNRSSLAALANDFGLLAIRGMVGVVFIFHGAQKLFGWWGGGGLGATAGFMEQIGLPLPGVSAFMAGAAEFFGGLALVLGLGTRLAAVPLVFTMLVASFVVHGGAFSARESGMEYPLTLAVVTLGLALTGGGRVGLETLVCPGAARDKAKDTAARGESASGERPVAGAS